MQSKIMHQYLRKFILSMTSGQRIALYVLLSIVALASCSEGPGRQDKEVDRAEVLMKADADSALAVLEAIDPSDSRLTL